MPSEHPPRISPTPGCSFVARVAFTWGERTFAEGDPFPYQEFGMTEDAAWNLWRSATINVAPPVVAVQPSSRPAVKHYHSRR